MGEPPDLDPAPTDSDVRATSAGRHTSDEDVEVGIGVAVGYHHDVELPRIRDRPYGEGHSRDQLRHREHLQQSRPGEIESSLRAEDIALFTLTRCLATSFRKARPAIPRCGTMPRKAGS